MAKTKALKQKEALARNLLQFEKDRNLYKRNAHGGDGYKLTKLMFSTKEADEDASESKNKMLASAARAQVDREGNPIEKITATRTLPRKHVFRKHDDLDAHCIIGKIAYVNI